MKKYVCVAGTFDGLHTGHEALLHAAFRAGDTVLIGLTSDAFVSGHKTCGLAPVSSYSRRKYALSGWLTDHGYIRRSRIVSIDDVYGPAVSDTSLAALIVSEESKAGGVKVNARRTALGLPALTLVVIPMVEAEDKAPISASRVRNGVIDRTGRLIMPETLRNELALPLGRVLTGSALHASFETHRQDRIITVGDRTTKALLDADITPALMIVDNKVNRLPFAGLVPLFAMRQFRTEHIASGPGFISREAIERIRNILDARASEPYVLDVDGEEDLLALPVILYAGEGSVVYYGQPPIPAWACGPEMNGVVEAVVTEEKKQEARDILAKFIRPS